MDNAFKLVFDLNLLLVLFFLSGILLSFIWVRRSFRMQKALGIDLDLF